MNKVEKIFHSLALSVVIISTALCADFFESLLVRLECYGDTQPGCDTDFIDAYPDLAWSYLNLTKATTHFYMFSRDNPDVPELLHKCAGKLPPNTNFRCECQTEIYLPGYTSGICNFAIYRELKNERLKSGCYNVILLDWMWGNLPDLIIARKNLDIVAKQLAVVIKNIKNQCGTGADSFILTGHSYGAHLAGLVGQIEPVGQINGIDPAGVTYTENTPLDERLDAGDAPCVQVMHCNAGQCLPGYFGVNFTCGTSDFWINGGLYQPSCYMQTLKSFIKKDYVYAFLSLYPAACQHFQCLHYYKASMNPDNCQFVGTQCRNDAEFQRGRCNNCGANGENCAVMGAYSCDCAKNGKNQANYFLNTGLKCPYCDNSYLDTRGLTCPATIIKE